MGRHLPHGYVLDPADPRSPSDEQWASMTPEERARAEDMLPSEPNVDFLPPPEGDEHWEASAEARTTLKSFFRRGGKSIYISGNIAVYYPGEPLFSPDLVAVLDVETHKRLTWSVRKEGKGLDVALEIHVAGDRKKDVKANVERYARLGIREYFVFDRSAVTLRGYRLPPADTKRTRAYQPIVPQGGRFASETLDLDLTIEGTTLRFYHTTAPLLGSEERLARVEGAFNDALQRAVEAEERVAELEQKIEERAAAMAEEQVAELEQKIEALEEELARLRGGGKKAKEAPAEAPTG